MYFLTYKNFVLPVIAFLWSTRAAPLTLDFGSPAFTFQHAFAALRAFAGLQCIEYFFSID